MTPVRPTFIYVEIRGGCYVCGVYTVPTESGEVCGRIVFISEHEKNKRKPCPSITNCIEKVVECLLQHPPAAIGMKVSKNSVFVEIVFHPLTNGDPNPTYDKVDFEWNDDKPSNPSWTRLPPAICEHVMSGKVITRNIFDVFKNFRNIKAEEKTSIIRFLEEEAERVVDDLIASKIIDEI